jgi:predicted  nucleic acid-binding Zn-ribbon protein
MGYIKTAQSKEVAVKLVNRLYRELHAQIENNLPHIQFPLEIESKHPRVNFADNQFSLDVTFEVPINLKTTSISSLNSFCTGLAESIKKNQSSDNPNLASITSGGVLLALMAIKADSSDLKIDTSKPFELVSTSLDDKPGPFYMGVKIDVNANYNPSLFKSLNKFACSFTVQINEIKIRSDNGKLNAPIPGTSLVHNEKIQFSKIGPFDWKGDYSGLKNFLKLFKKWEDIPSVEQTLTVLIPRIINATDNTSAAKKHLETRQDLTKDLEKIEELHQNVLDIESSVASEDLSKNIAKLYKLSSQINKKRKELQEEESDLESSLSGLEDALTQKEKELSDLRTEIPKIQAGIAAGTPAPRGKKPRTLQRKLRLLAAEKTQIEQELTDTKQRLTDLQDTELKDIIEKRNHLDEVFGPYQELQKNFISLGKEISKLLETKDKKTKQFNSPDTIGTVKNNIVKDINDLETTLSKKVLILEKEIYPAIQSLSETLKSLSIEDMDKYTPKQLQKLLVDNFDIAELQKVVDTTNKLDNKDKGSSEAALSDREESDRESHEVTLNMIKNNENDIDIFIKNYLWRHVHWDNHAEDLVSLNTLPGKTLLTSDNPFIRNFKKLRERIRGEPRLLSFMKILFPSTSASRGANAIMSKNWRFYGYLAGDMASGVNLAEDYLRKTTLTSTS